MKNILFIGAHPDDIELGAGGVISKFAEDSTKSVWCVTVTEGHYINPFTGHERSINLATKESENARKILKIPERNWINLKVPRPIEYTKELISLIEKIIIDNSIDTIFTHWDKDTHQEHVAVAKASISAGRHVQKILMYQSNWNISSGVFHENYFVDISNFIIPKLDSISAHETEFKKYGSEWLEYFMQKAKIKGIQIGTKYAESFQIVKFIE